MEQCHEFLLEELEPEHLLRNEKLANILEPVMEKLRKVTNRITKVEEILKHLEKQTEEIIGLVLKTYREDSVVHKFLFPNTKEFKDAGKYIL